jgi:signal transduction histidine kinase
MAQWARNPGLWVQAVLFAASLWLAVIQFRAIGRLEAAEFAVRNSIQQKQDPGPAPIRPLYVDRVFSFPENTCGPTPNPVFKTDASSLVTQSPSIARLARDQLRYGLLLSACLLTGLFLGAAFSFRAARREARVAFMKSSFVSNVSHEMKTPLATIQMFSETLESGRVRDSAKLNEYHRVIHKESLRLGQMIEDVLDFARLENQSRKYQFTPTDIYPLLSSLVEDFRGQVEHCGGTLQLALANDLPRINADAKAIRQAVQNLLSNALKYSPDRKEIRLTAGWEGRHLAVTVEDRGIGIPGEEQQKIFDKFYRVDTGLVHNTKGAGLGLAMVREIVKAHKGRIEVQSAPGQGSRFTLFLPLSSPGPLPWITNADEPAETADRRG